MTSWARRPGRHPALRQYLNSARLPQPECISVQGSRLQTCNRQRGVTTTRGLTMITRRFVLAGAAALAFTASASAQDWKSKYPELTFAVVPAENASGVTERWTPFVTYLSKELGIKVTLRIANDYAAVIEGQRAGNIHIASYGSASFARALKTGAPVEAFCIEVNDDGTKGYHSVFYVKKDSPYQKIEDLKGTPF